MNRCLHFLYESMLRGNPFVPLDSVEQYFAAQLENAWKAVNELPEEYHDSIFELRDALDYLAHAKACHAFRLGLDMGMSITQELRLSQDEE